MIEIIPAIDIIDGRCVRLEQGDYERETVYSTDPIETARRFEAAGIERLHLVDLDGARSGQIRNLAVLRGVADSTSLKVDFSGGIRDETSVRSAFDAGAAYVAIGSAAIKQPDAVCAWIDTFGPDRFLIGADVRGSRVAVNGWIEQTDIDLFSHIDNFVRRGIGQVFVTDIARDGVLNGPAIELYQNIIRRFPGLRLIASGGVSKIEDVEDLEAIGCGGVIIGKAIYEGKITLDQLKGYAR